MEESKSSTQLASGAVASRSRWLTPGQFQGLSLSTLLGEGSSARVFQSQTSAGSLLAVKVAKPGFEENLRKEARSLAILGPDFGPRLRGLAYREEGLCLVCDRVPGRTLDAFLDEEALLPAERFELAQVVLRVVGDALRRVHSLGWSHGDIKPENLMVQREPDWSAKLLDWGLASQAGEIEGGTLRYLPVELLAGNELSPQQADAFALALTLVEVLVPQARKSDPASLPWKDVPTEFRDILQPVVEYTAQQPPSLSWLLDEGSAQELIKSSSREVDSLLRVEYLSTRLFELEALAPQARLEITGRPAIWCEELILALNAIKQSDDVPVPRGGGESLGLSVLGGMSGQEKRRFLARVVGPSAASWRIYQGSDEALIELLSEVGHRIGLRGIVQGDLQSSSPRTEAREAEDSADSLEQHAEWGIALGRRPVPRRLLLRIAGDSNVPERLLWEAGRAARQMGEVALALRLLKSVSAPEGRVEMAIALSRQGKVNVAASLLKQLLEESISESARAHAEALLARQEIDRGRPEAALDRLGAVFATAPVHEVRALGLLLLSRLEEASYELDAGDALTVSDEQAARLLGVRGMLEHARGEPQQARAYFAQAMELASRSGSVLEEATYATGLASAASDAGFLADALVASERAEALFESLGRSAELPRALLARASVLVALDSQRELGTVIRRGISLARLVGDFRCEAYLFLCACDAEPQAKRRRQELEQAEALLVDAGEEERLALATRRLRVLGETQRDADAWAERAERLETRAEWWQARAEALEATSGFSDEERFGAAARVVRELVQISAETRTIAAIGPALVAGAHLALRLGQAEEGRSLLARASEQATHFLAHVPEEYRSRARHLSWVEQSSGRRLGEESGAAQLSDVESLLRALSGRKSFAALLDQVLDMLLLWTGVERGLILLRAPGDQLAIRAGRNLDRRDLSPEQRTLSLSMARRAMAEGRAVVAVDAMHDVSGVHRSVHALSLRSVLAVPLVARGEALGVIYLDDKVRRAAFGEQELSWVNLIGTVAGLAIFDHRDHLDLKRALGRARRAESRLEQRLSTREAELELAERELLRFRGQDAWRGDYSQIIGHGAAMTKLLSVVDRVAGSDVPALILGESGTGKELIARAITMNGERRGRALIVENCAAIPEGLQESTLFGHMKGAFTGASKNQPGLFALADRGTLFLDEIGEMSLTMQTKLLRVLQEGEIRPLGADESRKVDVRLIVATHRDLKRMVEEGRFREDLYYRLNVVTLEVPSLRRRQEDIPALIAHFIERYGQGKSRRLSEAALARLCSYPWPGNVRQLENEVRRMLVLGGENLTAADLSPEVLAGSQDLPQARTLREKVDALERRLVIEALEEVGGNRTRAAEQLGLSRFGLQKMAQRLNIEVSKSTPKSGRNKDRGLDDC